MPGRTLRSTVLALDQIGLDRPGSAWIGPDRPGSGPALAARSLTTPQ
jgi:hypothetical protein